ncbi:MAG TPA: permease [Acidimicrobiales bacterium]|nr:permease [Acidimicrobiales bacterium]
MISIFSFVCSIGNVPLAAVLWNGGIGFGGVISFIFADLIILPILIIYRKYYGTKMMLFVLGTFYATMVVAGYAVELIFGAAGLIPATRNAKVSTRPSAGTTPPTSTSSSWWPVLPGSGGSS